MGARLVFRAVSFSSQCDRSSHSTFALKSRQCYCPQTISADREDEIRCPSPLRRKPIQVKIQMWI
jgi:hypothetical protein